MREKTAKKVDALLEEACKPEDTSEPDVSNRIDFKELQANLSALLYIITEQQTLIAELLSTLLDAGVLSDASLYRVTSAVTDGELKEAVYRDLHQKYTEYFLKTKWLLMSTEEQNKAIGEVANLNTLDEEDDDGNQ